MSNIQKQILDSIDILLDKRVSQLDFDRTVRATIVSVEDASIGKCKVRYQNSLFYAYGDPDVGYEADDQVYVEIPSSDYNKRKLIVGTVKELGTRFIDAVTAEGKMTVIGNNILSSTQTISFCSYNGKQQRSITNLVSVDATALSTYKQSRKYFLLGMNVRTNLPAEQQVAGGNYGIILQAKYYNATYKNKAVQTDDDLITRTYVLDVNNMQGQPYKYSLKNRQYAIFSIDGDNLKEISDIQAFCTGFPVTKEGQPDDIFLSDFELEFMEPLTDAELSSASLKILTPQGTYLESLNDDTRWLQAQLKIKGRQVNLQSQPVNFYWFVKDATVSASDTLHYSNYGGEGWRCLNQSQTYNNVTQFIPDTVGKFQLRPSLVRSKTTTFKCVAVYDTTTLNATIQIQNRASQTQLFITSSAGRTFYFDSGRTTLTCEINTDQQNLTYNWGYRNTDGSFVSVDSHEQSIDISIGEITDLVTYECTVQANGEYLGTASIVLTNGTPSNGYTLVINNGTQVFKYDAYGVSPASPSLDKPITINALSFDIYNDQGQIVTPSDDDQKIKMCSIKWIWPDETLTMLEHPDISLIEDTVINPITNTKTLRYIIQDLATVTFGIKDKYDISLVDNNIRLEVSFQGHNLVASTSFTFVKEGDLGTNGTQYISRIVPRSDRYTRVYVENNHFEGWYNESSKVYDPATGRSSTTDDFTFEQIMTSFPLKTQLWDGNNTSIFDSQNNRSEIDATQTWEIVDIGRRTEHNLTVGDYGRLAIEGHNQVSTVVKTTIATRALSEQVRKYYATYPVDVVTTPGDDYHAVVTGGYRQCRYESDGTRSNFTTQPFTLRIFHGTEELPVDASTINWYVSWYGSRISDQNVAIDGQNGITIEPPSMYNSESTNNFIACNYNNGEYVVIISVHLYLNRSGLGAMNDWDGTSIKLNEDGSQYIMAPQIGAGERDSSGRFTGMTMGKSFGVDGKRDSSQVGLMGFYQGTRTIFLDAETGKAMFGRSGDSRIVISPESYGRAPRGSIFSGNYYWYDTNGRPSSERGEGLLIDLVTPQIRFGSGDFIVDKNGHLTAKGGGSIGGWQIDDNSLYSNISRSNGRITLCSGTYDRNTGEVTGPGYIYSHSHSSLKSSGEGFYLGRDGLSIGSQVRIDADTGIARFGRAAIGGSNDYNWTIDSTESRSWISTISKRSLSTPADPGVYLGTDGISLGALFKVDNNGRVSVGLGAVDNSDKRHWIIYGNRNEGKSYISYNTTSLTIGNDNSVYFGTDGLSLGSMFYVNAKGEMRIGIDAVKSRGKHWTIKAADGDSTNNSYIGYNKTRLKTSTDGVYLGTDGLSIGTITGKRDTTGKGIIIDVDHDEVAMSGWIYADGGKIGNLYIENGALHSQNKRSASSGDGVWIDQNCISVGNLGESRQGSTRVSGAGFRVWANGDKTSVRIQGGSLVASSLVDTDGFEIIKPGGQINTRWMHIVDNRGNDLGGLAPRTGGGVISGMELHATEHKWYFDQGIEAGSASFHNGDIDLNGDGNAIFKKDVTINGALHTQAIDAKGGITTSGMTVTGGATFQSSVTFKEKPSLGLGISDISGLQAQLDAISKLASDAATTASEALSKANSSSSSSGGSSK